MWENEKKEAKKWRRDFSKSGLKHLTLYPFSPLCLCCEGQWKKVVVVYLYTLLRFGPLSINHTAVVESFDCMWKKHTYIWRAYIQRKEGVLHHIIKKSMWIYTKIFMFFPHVWHNVCSVLFYIFFVTFSWILFLLLCICVDFQTSLGHSFDIRVEF